MKNFGFFVAKHKKLIVLIAILLLIPALYGFFTTKINYDILTYLPKNLDSMKGQEILDKDFKQASLSMLIVQNNNPNYIKKIKDKISKVNGVDKVIWIDDIVDNSIPNDMLPEEIRSTFYSSDSTLLLIKFLDSPSSASTQKAIGEIRKIMDKSSYLSGMSAIIKDTKDISDRETPIYVIIAVVFSFILLTFTMESPIVPFIFLLCIGIAIIYNLGSNRFLGQISYITKSLAAVLQLGVTMDFSIFLLHRFEEEKKKFQDTNEAMAEAISKTIVAIGSSAATAVAGFLALCVMKLKLGVDIGIVMAKGVFLGVLSTITILPAFILLFDKLIDRVKMINILPTFNKTAQFVSKFYHLLVALMILLILPAIYGANNTKVYYNLIDSLPKTLKSVEATDKLKKDYNMTTTHMIIVKDNISNGSINKMCSEIENVSGVTKVLAFEKFVGGGIPSSFIPETLKENFEANGYKLILVNSLYKAATNEANIQIDRINKIIKKYSKESIVAGEGALTKDLVEIAKVDFKRVDFVSIIAIFLIILLTFRSISIPVILVGSIELAIFINMSIPYYTNKIIPFIASIVIGTIQLGSTVNYAILLTTRFREELRNGLDKIEAIKVAISASSRSIVTSALAFCLSTLSVAIVAQIDMIKTLCLMLSRGALISMFVIIYLLPALLVLFEGLISKTTRGWQKTIKEEYETV